MHRLLVLGVAAVAGGLLLASPALAGPPEVEVENRGGCYHVLVNGKDVTFNGICYLGPPPPD